MNHDQALIALQAALATVPLAQGRSYPAMMVQAVQQFPCIRYQQVGGANALGNCESSEEGDDLRIQIDCMASEYGQMRALRAEVVAAIDAAVGLPMYRASPGLDLPFDSDARVFRHTMDYIIALSNQ